MTQLKQIGNVPEDVFNLLKNPSSELGLNAASLGDSIGKIILQKLEADTSLVKERLKDRLWPTELGETCDRKLWYERNLVTLKEDLLPHNHMKFLYGDMMETVLLDLVEMAGHTVTNRQAKLKLILDGVTLSGKIDAIIDNHIVDVKCVSSRAFKKFKEGRLELEDDFGYIPQLESYWGYHEELTLDTPVNIIMGAGFLVLNKETGDLLYHKIDTTKLEAQQNTKERIQRLGAVIGRTEKPSTRLSTIPYGKSGNQALQIKCSYCPYKKECWSDANSGHGLRLFSYRQGPVFLTEVKDEPRVLELPY